jgi:hypothetical protein
MMTLLSCHDVLDVLEVQAVGLEKLADAMDALGLGLEGLLELLLQLHPLAGILLGAGVDLVQPGGDDRAS